ncbi:MAG: hypothetical protein ABUK01_13550 [Leptospirales bacterium]
MGNKIMNTKQDKTIGLIYEISKNPFFNKEYQSTNKLLEYMKPNEIEPIKEALLKLGYQVEIIDGVDDLMTRIDEIKNKVSLLFNKSLGDSGLEKKITVPAIARHNGIPLVGASAYGLTLGRNKFHSNRLLHGLGVRVPHAMVFYPEYAVKVQEGDFSFPVLAKPSNESNSLGLSDKSILNTPQEVIEVVTDLLKAFRQPITVEEFIPGDEWSVSVIGNKPDTLSLGCVTNILDGKSMAGKVKTREHNVDGAIKYEKASHPQLIDEALRISEKIHDHMEFYDYSRIDFRIGSDDQLYCMELTPHPDLRIDSSYVPAALQTLPDYETMIDKIVSAAHTRSQNGSYL